MYELYTRIHTHMCKDMRTQQPSRKLHRDRIRPIYHTTDDCFTLIETAARLNGHMDTHKNVVLKSLVKLKDIKWVPILYGQTSKVMY